MKYLFCGLGSIGQRHLNNLISLGEKNIIAFRSSPGLLPENIKKIPVYKSLKEALDQKPDVVFITNPSIFHMSYALASAERNCHLFIEKPLAVQEGGINKLQKITGKKLTVFIGFMMRYHPAVKQIKKWLKEKTIGFPISVRMTYGEYLPLWHPWENYQKSYAGKKELGGGPINTLSHEVDLINYFFGKPESVFALASRNSSLKISTEHSAEILFQFPDKMLASIHLDYLQNPPKRTWEIVGDKGRIEFDYYSGELELYLTDKKTRKYKNKKINYKNNFKRNDMFKEELTDFISGINNHRPSHIPLRDGIINTRLLLAIHSSIKNGKKIKIKY